MGIFNRFKRNYKIIGIFKWILKDLLNITTFDGEREFFSIYILGSVIKFFFNIKHF